jgi:hypothetical protein
MAGHCSGQMSPGKRGYVDLIDGLLDRGAPQGMRAVVFITCSNLPQPAIGHRSRSDRLLRQSF